MAIRNRPALHPKRYESFALIAYGELELKTFREQSIGYNRGLVSEASETVLLPIINRGHFVVLDELMDSDGAIFRALMDRLNLK